MRRPDLWIAGALIGLSAWAVWAQIGSDPVGEALARQGVTKLEMGEALEDQEVLGANGTALRLHALLGTKATVFYAWSSTCPCMDFVNERLLPAIERFKPMGVAFLAVAGDPADSENAIAVRQIVAWGPRKDGTPRTPNGLPPYGDPPTGARGAGDDHSRWQSQSASEWSKW